VNLVVVVETPEDLKMIMNSENCLDKSPFYEFLKLEKGLFVAKKEMWKVHRKLLTPAFNKNMLLTSIVTFNEKSRRLRKKLDAKVDAAEFNFLHNITILVLETIFMTVLDVNCEDEYEDQLIKYMEESQM
jgi:cytochrome P450